MNILYKKRSTQIILLLFIFINILFAYKYISRYSNYSSIITGFYAILLYYSSNYLLNYGNKILVNNIYYVIGCYIIIIIFIFYMTDPHKIRVDRWSVITAFWDAVDQGIFPYQVKSHLGCYPGPFPFYFILAFPSYLLGEIGYFSLSGFILMVYNIRYYYRNNLNAQITSMFLLISSLAILWEMIVRSTVLINAALILIYMIWLLDIKEYKVKTIVGYGIVGGLLISTRAIFILPIISTLTYLYVKQLKIKEIIIYSVSFVISFIITLLPLILWDSDLFNKYNPITLQSGLIGLHIAIILAVISIAIGFICKNDEQLIFGVGLVIFMAAIIYFLERLITYGLNPQILENNVDISYFILAIPFLLVSIDQRQLKLQGDGN